MLSTPQQERDFVLIIRYKDLRYKDTSEFK